MITEWRDVFAGTLPHRYVHIIAWIPGMLSKTMSSIFEADNDSSARFFQTSLRKRGRSYGKRIALCSAKLQLRSKNLVIGLGTTSSKIEPFSKACLQSPA